MNYITETLKTRVAGEYDVIVAGGGPAGCSAAIAAARAGARTLLLEKQTCLGGMWTSGLVNPLFDGDNKDGLMREIINELDKKDAWGGFWNHSFNYEYMKKLLENLCTDAGVEVLLDTHYSGTLTENGHINGVLVQNIEGRSAYLGKIVIDATADASVAADSGVRCFIGENDDYKTCQAITLMFLISNIPEKYKEGHMLFETLTAAFDKQGEGRKSPYVRPWIIPIPNSRFAVVQLTHMREKNMLSAKGLTEALSEGRQQMIDVFEALKTYDADFRDLELVFSAPALGVRESRRIEGEYTLVLDDVINGIIPDDSVTIATFNIDVHHAGATTQRIQKVPPYGIPYRCLLAKGTDNLLVAGRCISGTHETMASYRVTGNCCAMGEAAGKAAAYAVRQNKALREIHPKEFMQ